MIHIFLQHILLHSKYKKPMTLQDIFRTCSAEISIEKHMYKLHMNSLSFCSCALDVYSEYIAHTQKYLEKNLSQSGYFSSISNNLIFMCKIDR